jgi:hypothetical protein
VELERKDRDSAAVGAQVTCPWPSAPRYECIACRAICYLSAVVCGCATSSLGPRRLGSKVGTSEAVLRVTCPRHSRQVCDCGPERRVLVTWYDLPALAHLAEGVVKPGGGVATPAPVAAAPPPAAAPAASTGKRRA